MHVQLKKIFSKYSIQDSYVLYNGSSCDRKYYLEGKDNQKYLLRVADLNLLDKKKSQFELLKQVEELNIFDFKALECEALDERFCYTITSWVENELEITPNDMSEEVAYEKGVKLGQILKQLHDNVIEGPKCVDSETHHQKMEEIINLLNEAEVELPMKESLIAYYNENVNAVKELNCDCGVHHLANMFVDNIGVGIIDFDRDANMCQIDDLEEYYFHSIINEEFESGLINGYFNNNVPTEFFKLLKFRIVETMLSNLALSILFDEENLEVISNTNELEMAAWNNLEKDSPAWYKGTKE